MNSSKPEYIIAIGGSVGYLPPLFKFFDQTLIDKVSYVVLRHILPETQSQLKEVLQRHSKLEVIEGRDDMVVENNKVYLLPAGYYMKIQHGILHLEKRTSKLNCAIDIFMQSLAADVKERSIGIIFSGGGSNGMEGAESIKKAGGMVLVQAPSSCESSLLPKRVINSGYYDYILLPEQMPAFILQCLADHLRKSRSGSLLE